MEVRDILHKSQILHQKDHLDIEFIAFQGELMPEEALKSFTVSDAYH